MPTVTGIATEFITFTRASNATVTDSDGLVKWAPANLLTNSESFDAASWLKTNAGSTTPTVTANAAVAPNGTTTAETVALGAIDAAGDSSVVYQTFTAVDATYRGGVYVKAATGGDVGKKVWMFMYDSAYRGVASVTLTTEWQLLSSTATLTAGSNRELYIATIGSTNGGENQGAVSVHLWGASLYRSDLAMQPNTSAYPMYNPTTPKNLLGYTEDFSNAYWTKYRSSAAAATNITAPNGLQTADKLVPQSSLTQGGIYNTVYTAVIGGVYTASVYAKAAELGFVFVCLNVRASSTTQGLCVNLANGARSNEGASGTYSVADVGNGWWRISCTGTANNTTGYLEVYPLAAAGTLNSYTGDGTSGIYLWGAQLSDSASLDSYVPVYGAAVTSAAYYGPRRDFDPVTLACKGLLVEEQRTNLLTYSAQFDNAAWTPTGATIAADVAGATAVAPDGTNTADKFVESNTTADHYLSRVSATQTIGTRYTLSWYVKASGRTKIRLYAYAMNNLIVFYDTATNTASYASGGTNYSFSMSDAGSGWYRCVATSDASAANNDFAINLVSTGTTVSYAGDGTSGVLLWGAQLEANAPFATSYIPVGATSAGATRNADVASVSTQAFPYSATEGTLVANGSWNGSASAGALFAVISDGGNSNRMLLYANNSAADAQFTVFNGGTPQADIGGLGATSAGQTFKAAAAYKANDFAAVGKSGSVSTDPSGTIPSVNILHLGSNLGTSTLLNGHIRQITYLPRRISNAELVTRST